MTRFLRKLMFGLALTLHIVLVLRSYPVTAWLANEPPLRGDVDRYYANAWGAAQAGGLYGYDVSCMAGYPVGLWNSMGKKGFEVAHLLLPGLPLPQLFYLVLVGFALGSPLLLYAAACPDYDTPRRRWLLLGMALLYWHLDAQISYFWGFGNVCFPGTVCLVASAVAVTARMLETRTGWAWGLLLGLLGAAVVYAHTILICALVVPLGVVIVARRAALRHLGAWVGMGVAVAVALALCLPWLVPLWQSRGDCVPQPHRWFPGGLKNLVMDVLSDRVYERAFDRNFLPQAAVITSIYGLWATRHLAGLLIVRALSAGAVGMLAITYIFPLLNIGGALQPYRFQIPSVLLLLPAATLGVDAAIEVARRLPREGHVLLVLLALLALPRLTAYGIDILRPPGSLGVLADYRAIAEVLHHEPVTGRVLCEDAGLGHALPPITGLPVIGGLSSQAFLKHRFAGVDEGGIVFGRAAVAWEPATLAAYLDTYAVSHVVFISGAWRMLAGSMPGVLQPVATIGGGTVYRVAGGARYARDAAAEVTVEPRAIVVRNVRAPSVVLKFHLDRLLVADHGVTLQPEVVLEDPVPFVRCVVPAGVEQFTIRWDVAARRIAD